MGWVLRYVVGRSTTADPCSAFSTFSNRLLGGLHLTDLDIKDSRISTINCLSQHAGKVVTMSRASKLTLAGTSLFALGTVFLVHFQQQAEKAVCYSSLSSPPPHSPSSNSPPFTPNTRTIGAIRPVPYASLFQLLKHQLTVPANARRRRPGYGTATPQEGTPT